MGGASYSIAAGGLSLTVGANLSQRGIFLSRTLLIKGVSINKASYLAIAFSTCLEEYVLTLDLNLF